MTSVAHCHFFCRTTVVLCIQFGNGWKTKNVNMDQRDVTFICIWLLYTSTTCYLRSPENALLGLPDLSTGQLGDGCYERKMRPTLVYFVVTFQRRVCTGGLDRVVSARWSAQHLKPYVPDNVKVSSYSGNKKGCEGLWHSQSSSSLAMPLCVWKAISRWSVNPD